MQNDTRVIELLKDIKQLLVADNKTGSKWMDIIQASKYCAVHPSTLRRSVKSGDLIASNKLGKTLFKQSELENWLN